ncbi:MAG: HD domain-containing protein [Patescibacteria group bacterium]|nr:HD domain-containing protein [Patescibacteria group bacterium]
MNHTPQIKKAIQFAARKHHGQMRAEIEPLPYITHLFSVALLAAEDGADDNVVTASLLHDTLEDTDTTREELVSAFNERVAEFVEAVSEIKEKDGEKIHWKERKTAYLANLETAPDEAVLIAIADKVDNVESMLEAFEKEGPSFLIRLNHSDTNNDQIWFHGEALRIAQTRLPEHRLTKRYAEVYARECAMLSEL